MIACSPSKVSLEPASLGRASRSCSSPCTWPAPRSAPILSHSLLLPGFTPANRAETRHSSGNRSKSTRSDIEGQVSSFRNPVARRFPINVPAWLNPGREVLPGIGPAEASKRTPPPIRRYVTDGLGPDRILAFGQDEWQAQHRERTPIHRFGNGGGAIAVNEPIFLLGPSVWLPGRSSRLQLAAPNAAGVSMGHLHLAVSDVESSKKFWVALGATAAKSGPLEGVILPAALILLGKDEPSGGTAGSVVNHVGFTVPNVAQAMAKWRAAGLKMEPGRDALQGFVFTPDDLMKIEILEDRSLTVPIAFHHIHFFVADSGSSVADSVAEIKAWYAQIFGAKPGKRGPFEADDLPGVNLTFSKSGSPTVGTKGRMLDHIGFEVKNLEAFSKNLETCGVNLDDPYTKHPEGIALARLTDPWGTCIELTEGLDGF